MKVLITGSEGFIGTHLKQVLPHDILEFDLKLGHDVRDRKLVADAVGKADVVYHLASIAGVDNVIKDPTETMRITNEGTSNVIEACNDRSIHRLVYVSTSEIFGSHADGVREHDPASLGPVNEARWTYACAKYGMEAYGHSYYRNNGLPFVSVRPFNIFGPGQMGPGAVKTILDRAVKNEEIVLTHRGEQSRSWCYIDDFIIGLKKCMEVDGAVGQCFNLGNRRNFCSIYSLARTILRISNSRSKIVLAPSNEPDVECRNPNIDKARDILGFNPVIYLDDGIALTLRSLSGSPDPHHPRWPGP